MTLKEIIEDYHRLKDMEELLMHPILMGSNFKKHRTTFFIPPIKKVIFNNPATIVIWEDGDKTVVKCGEYERFDPEKGLAMAISKKALGNKGKYYEVFKKWLPEERYFEEDVAESFRRLAENVHGFKKKDGTEED